MAHAVDHERGILNMGLIPGQSFAYAEQFAGERIVWVNFIWKNAIDDSDDLSKEIFMHLDGCSRYWNVKVNITKDTLYDLFINESA